MAERARATQAVLVERLRDARGSLQDAGRYALILVSGGACRMDTPQKTFSVKRGEALLIRPGLGRGLTMDEDAQGLCIVFAAEPFMQSCLPMLSRCPLIDAFFEDGCAMTFLHFEDVSQGILRFISENCCDTTLEAVAAQFNYHPNTVAQMVRRETGRSFQELRRQMRLERAAYLLGQKQLSAQQAAMDCGYSNMSNFYTQFERAYGMTPGEYARQQHKA